MPKIIRNEIEYSSTTSTANQISYLNTASGLSANNVQGAIDEVVAGLDDKADRVPEPAEYDSTATYNVGDFVTYNDNIYTCTTDISTAEAWNPAHWQLVDADDSYLHSLNPKGAGAFSFNRKANTTIGSYSFAEGYNTTASGMYSHAEGARCTASSMASHAEGYYTTAYGVNSHAEGYQCNAYGGFAHAEGEETSASGAWGAHAEGGHTVASGTYSHAEGYYTTAQRKSQHVFGEYNILDTAGSYGTDKGNYVEIVGNGTGTSARSNARTLDWSGNEVLSGSLTAKSCSIQNSSGTQTIGLDGSTGNITCSTVNGVAPIKITTQTFSLDNLTIASNTDYNYQIDVTKTGYTPIGIIQASFLGNYGTRFHFCKLNIASNTANVSFRANSSETFSSSGFQVVIVVLYTG